MSSKVVGVQEKIYLIQEDSSVFFELLMYLKYNDEHTLLDVGENNEKEERFMIFFDELSSFVENDKEEDEVHD